MSKDYNDWHRLKSELHDRADLPTFQEREIWWCSIGLNIGHEQDGKHEEFHRPVIIIRKFSRATFLGVPLTTSTRERPYYHPITFKGRPGFVILSQIRLWASNRLSDKMGQLGKKEFEEIRAELRKLF